MPDPLVLAADVETLVRKAEAGASFAVTQMVFDPETYLALRDRVNARVDLPITEAVSAVLAGHLQVDELAGLLLSRKRKHEGPPA